MHACLSAAEMHSLVAASTDSQGQLAIQHMPGVLHCLKLAQMPSAWHPVTGQAGTALAPGVS